MASVDLERVRVREQRLRDALEVRSCKLLYSKRHPINQVALAALHRKTWESKTAAHLGQRNSQGQLS